MWWWVAQYWGLCGVRQVHVLCVGVCMGTVSHQFSYQPNDSAVYGIPSHTYKELCRACNLHYSTTVNRLLQCMYHNSYFANFPMALFHMPPKIG